MSLMELLPMLRVRHHGYQNLRGVALWKKLNGSGITFVRVRWDSGYEETIQDSYLVYE